MSHPTIWYFSLSPPLPPLSNLNQWDFVSKMMFLIFFYTWFLIFHIWYDKPWQTKCSWTNESFLTKQEEFYRTTFAEYFRTADECKKPFESEDSPVRKAGLSLVSMETKIVRCPYYKKWMKDGGDPKAHARWYVPALKPWSNSTFMSGKLSYSVSCSRWTGPQNSVPSGVLSVSVALYSGCVGGRITLSLCRQNYNCRTTLYI